MKTHKTRQEFSLPDDLVEELRRLTRRPGTSRTSIVTDALRAWIDRKAASELDERFGPRLDRQLAAIRRLEELATMTAEVLDLFVQHQLTIVAHQPPFSEETGALGLRRYRQFMEQVARRMTRKGGRPRFAEPEGPTGNDPG